MQIYKKFTLKLKNRGKKHYFDLNAELSYERIQLGEIYVQKYKNTLPRTRTTTTIIAFLQSGPHRPANLSSKY